MGLGQKWLEVKLNPTSRLVTFFFVSLLHTAWISILALFRIGYTCKPTAHPNLS